MKLSTTERNALLAVSLRVAEVRSDEAAIYRDIEARLKLPPGSLGTTHRIDGQAGEVRDVRPAASQPAANGDAAGGRLAEVT